MDKEWNIDIEGCKTKLKFLLEVQGMGIKKLFLTMVLVFGLTALCFAESPVSFTWNANSEPDLAGYRLYQSAVSGDYVFGEVNSVKITLAGTETCTLSNVLDGEWFWVLTAYDNYGNESGRSNEVTKILDTIGPDPPASLQIP